MEQRNFRQLSARKKYPGYWVLLFTLPAFGLRLQQLGFQPLWGDEGWSIYFATQSFPQLLALTAIDIHPPLYYLLLKIWMFFVGVGPEAARLFSVFIGTLLIPVVGVLGKRLGNRQIGAVSAAVTALMPMALYYSQEVRMYGLVTLLGAMSIYFFMRNKAVPRPNFGYFITTTAALYTMYYAVFLVLAQFIYAVVIFLSRKNRRSFFAAFKPFIVVGLLYLPWIIYAGLQLVSYVSNKRDVEGYVPLNLIRYLGDHLAAFSVGHLPLNFQPYVWMALPAIIATLLGIWAVRYFPDRQAIILYFYLGVPLLLGYLVNQIFPFTPRFFERTLLLVAPAYWLLMGVGIIWLWKRQYLLVGTLVAAVLVPVVISLIMFYTVPRYPNQDYRPLLRHVAARVTPKDTILASYQWQLGFYQAYLPQPWPQMFAVPQWGAGWSSQTGNSAQLTQDLTAIFKRSPRLWFPAYQAGGHIWEDEAEAAIAKTGFPALLQWYSPEIKLTLAGASQAPARQISAANFENQLTLTSATIGGSSYQAGRDIVPVELQWRKEKHLGSEHQVSLRLVDETGRTWAIRDSHPRAGQACFTDMDIGDTLLDRHGFLTPAGAPPGVYRLLLGVRRASDAHPLDILDKAGQPLGAEYLLAKITLAPPLPAVGAAALPVQTATEALFGSETKLIGYSLGNGPFKSGEVLPIIFFWESLIDAPGPLTVWVDLQDLAGQTVFSYSQTPLWPATEWRQGTVLRDPHDIILPPTLLPGQYKLRVAVLDSAKNHLPVNGVSQLLLQTITTIDRPRVFEAPVSQFNLEFNLGNQIKLAGINLPQTEVNAGEYLPLTLHWQAVNTPDRSWTIFVHLTDIEGNIIAQQDQIPGGGQFPTTGWVANEYLVDQLKLFIPPETPPGQQVYQLKIGLYDANNFSRLPVIESGEITGDHITLESWPISVE